MDPGKSLGKYACILTIKKLTDGVYRLWVTFCGTMFPKLFWEACFALICPLFWRTNPSVIE